MKQLLFTLTAAAALLTPFAAAPAQAQASGTPVVVIFMENHALSFIKNHPSLVPYEYSLWNFTGSTPSMDFMDYTNLAHPSLPNYLAFASGYTQATSDSVHPGQFTGPTVWDQLTSAGVSWGVYEEGMDTPCSGADYVYDTATGGEYVLRHNPALTFGTVYFDGSQCMNVQPLSQLGQLRQVSFITPNICDDMHGIPSGSYDPFSSCVKGSTALASRSDAWLAQLVPQLARQADVIIAFDECCSTYPSGKMYAVETGPAVVNGTKKWVAMNHYSILAGIEDHFGLGLLGGALLANPAPLPRAPQKAPVSKQAGLLAVNLASCR